MGPAPGPWFRGKMSAMGKAAPARRLTPEEYLTWERAQPTRHEYLNGEVFAMAGASPAHNDIVANILGELREALRDKPCRARASDQRVKIPATGLYTYPDVLVMCGTPEYEAGEPPSLINPTVVIEVLSDSTERDDRGKKFRHYRTIPSLQDYVLASQDSIWIEHYIRREKDVWELHDTLPGGTLSLASCGVELRVDELYLKVFDAV